MRQGSTPGEQAEGRHVMPSQPLLPSPFVRGRGYPTLPTPVDTAPSFRIQNVMGTAIQDFWQGQRVCVTGGTGFLGWHLVGLLRQAGAEVVALGLPPPHPLPSLPGVRWHLGDLRDPELVRQAVAGCEVIFHTAAVVRFGGRALRRLVRVNELVTRKVLENSPPAARIVFTSSIVAVGASRQPVELTEDSPFTLAGLAVDYVRSKRETEELALQLDQGRRLVVVNPGYLIGPEDFGPSEMGRICRRFWNGRVPIALAGGFNVVDVRDVALGHLLAAQRGQPGRRYLLGGYNLSIKELFLRLAEAAGWRPRWLPCLPSWLATGLAWIATARCRLTGKETFPTLHQARLSRYYWYASSERARQELGYHTRPLEQTLAETFSWFQSHYHLQPRGLNRWWMGAPLPASPARRSTAA